MWITSEWSVTKNLKIGHYKKIGMEKRKPTAGKGDGLGC
jgi:hypothetical protein